MCWFYGVGWRLAAFCFCGVGFGFLGGALLLVARWFLSLRGCGLVWVSTAAAQMLAKITQLQYLTRFHKCKVLQWSSGSRYKIGLKAEKLMNKEVILQVALVFAWVLHGEKQ
ncbi:hypothetical protein U1Q18_019443 [Sarracenia purpurea var. burkii]